MGRYAQRQRRGGGPSTAADPVDPPAVIQAVQVAGGVGPLIVWTWDQPITLIGANVPGLELVNGEGGAFGPQSCAQAGATSIEATYDDSWGGGNTYRLLADPSPDLVSAGGFVVPATGPLSGS